MATQQRSAGGAGAIADKLASSGSHCGRPWARRNSTSRFAKSGFQGQTWHAAKGRFAAGPAHKHSRAAKHSQSHITDAPDIFLALRTATSFAASLCAGLLKFPDNGLELDAAALLLLQHLARGDAVLARQLLQLGAEDSLKALLASRPAELHNLLSTTLALLTSGSVSTSMACLPQAPTHPSGRGGPGWAAGLLAPHRPPAPLSGCSSLSLRSSTDSQPCPAKRGSTGHAGQAPSQLLEGPPPAPHSQHCSAWTVGEGAPPSLSHTLTPAPGYDQHRHVSGGQGPPPQAAQPPLPVNRPLDIEAGPGGGPRPAGGYSTRSLPGPTLPGPHSLLGVTSSSSTQGAGETCRACRAEQHLV
ncbi:hypothetical protein HaLaN_22579 [Haematococcus lacustris]|uniref:Uncharacterized protein n=1 Tax=Haematococcus lacustris TaxID=44745 RepID=A0A6A0A143_HAELA|nr:hypothetical protein HaLaN_22579 [Haematococcus lacustris]